MKKSETIGALAKALAAFQMEVKDPSKDKNNPFFKSKYVALDGLLAAVRPVLAKNGLSFLQFPGGDGQVSTMTTILMHESGEWIESDPLTMKPAKNDPQGVGSCITYARRYSLQSVLGIAWEEDDDANNASYTPQDSAGAKKSAKPNTSTNTQKKVAESNTDFLNEGEEAQLLNNLMETMKKEGIGNEEMGTVIKVYYGKNKWRELTPIQMRELSGRFLNIWADVMKKLGEGAA